MLKFKPSVSTGKHMGKMQPRIPIMTYTLNAKCFEYLNSTCAKYGVVIPPILIKALPSPKPMDLTSVGYASGVYTKEIQEYDVPEPRARNNKTVIPVLSRY